MFFNTSDLESDICVWTLENTDLTSAANSSMTGMKRSLLSVAPPPPPLRFLYSNSCSKSFRSTLMSANSFSTSLKLCG